MFFSITEVSLFIWKASLDLKHDNDLDDWEPTQTYFCHLRPHSLAKNFPPWADDFLKPHLVSLSRKRKWVIGSMWPNGPTHQSDIFFFFFFLNVAKGSDDTEWHGRCQAHPVNMLKGPTSNATDACSRSLATSSCVFTRVFLSSAVTAPTKASEQDVAGQKEPAPPGNECHQVGRGTAAGDVQGGKCASLWSPPPPWGITQLDSRLFFPLPLPDWFLLLPGYSLSSASLLCIVIMQRTPRALTDHWYSLSVKWQRFKSGPLI